MLDVTRRVDAGTTGCGRRGRRRLPRPGSVSTRGDKISSAVSVASHNHVARLIRPAARPKEVRS